MRSSGQAAIAGTSQEERKRGELMVPALMLPGRQGSRGAPKPGAKSSRNWSTMAVYATGSIS